MRHTLTPKLLFGAATLVMGWVSLTALQCTIGDTTGPVQGCTTSPGVGFPSAGSLSLNRPANCPIHVLGPDTIPYAATAVIPENSGVQDNAFDSYVVTWNGATVSDAISAVWSLNNGNYVVGISGTYFAADGLFDNLGTSYDDVYNRFLLTDGTWVVATARIPYVQGNPSNDLNSNAIVEPNQPYTVTASTNDPHLVSPLTWTWYANDEYLGATSDPQFTVTAGNASTQQIIRATASDLNGRTTSGETTVNTSAGCGTQLIC